MAKSIRSGMADIVSGSAILVGAAVMLLHTFSDRYDLGMLFGDVSTVFFPRVVLGALMLLSAVLVVRGVRAGEGEALGAIDAPRLALVAVVAALTALGVFWLSFMLVMPIGIFGVGWTLGFRRPVPLAVASIAGPAVVLVALERAANVAVPTGLLGF